MLEITRTLQHSSFILLLQMNRPLRVYAAGFNAVIPEAAVAHVL